MSPEYNLPSLGSQLGLIIVIKTDSFPNPASQRWQIVDLLPCNTTFGRKIWTKRALKEAALYSFNTSLQEKTTPRARAGHPDGFRDTNPAAPFSHSPQWKAHGLFPEPRVPFLSPLCSVFSSAAVSMAGFIPSTKNALPAPPRHPRLPSSSFSFALPSGSYLHPGDGELLFSLRRLQSLPRCKSLRRRRSPSAYWSRKTAAKGPAAVTEDPGYNRHPCPPCRPRCGSRGGPPHPTDRAAPLARLPTRALRLPSSSSPTAPDEC